MMRPMLATAGDPPTGPGWAYEFKWDGLRALADVVDGRLRLFSRLGNDITLTYPELGALAGRLGQRSVLLDGEIVALDDMGRPALRLLQRRMNAIPRAALVAHIPVCFFVFDVLSYGLTSVRREPYDRRRALLAALRLDAGAAGPIRVPGFYTDVDGPTMLTTARAHGLEGIVAKRRSSTYQPGKRVPGLDQNTQRCEAIMTIRVDLTPFELVTLQTFLASQLNAPDCWPDASAAERSALSRVLSKASHALAP